ncbi:MAG: NAD(P)-dependent glycerol-3-phosphate dehydrogenase [Elusimicrobia bacterium]|nr:NAD(P)-dependent glycerol-3-phosphate dehydrogenase [Elusimicrobiota bacterium]
MKISVLGAGAWGATLAQHLYENGHNVSLWEFDESRIAYIKRHRYPMFFPHINLSEKIFITNNIISIIEDAEVILLVIPSQVMRATLREILKYTNKTQIFVIASKGLEIKTGKRLSEIVREELGTKNIVVLSGPSFAIEVAQKLPTTIVAAGEQNRTLIIQKIFLSKYLKIYTNSDITGVEIGGALKNVIAIACGIARGKGLGDNTTAAIITRGLVELVRLGVKCGAKKETFSGLSGLGDLVMTSFSKKSRNESFGELVGSGLKTDDAIKKIGMTVEGVFTTKAVVKLAKKLKIEMPITNEVHKIIFENKDPEKAIISLMSRSAKPE